MWFATPNGLNVLSKGQWRVFTVHDGLPSADLNCVLANSTGVLWIGSTAGIAFLTSDHCPGSDRGAGTAARADIRNCRRQKWVALDRNVESCPARKTEQPAEKRIQWRGCARVWIYRWPARYGRRKAPSVRFCGSAGANLVFHESWPLRGRPNPRDRQPCASPGSC
jgi:hypothetical protein